MRNLRLITDTFRYPTIFKTAFVVDNACYLKKSLANNKWSHDFMIVSQNIANPYFMKQKVQQYILNWDVLLNKNITEIKIPKGAYIH
jgi:hypothetical protein